MESLLLSRFTPSPTCTSSPLRLRLHSSLRFRPPPRHRPIRLNASPGGSGTSDKCEDGEVGEIEDDLSTLPGNVIDAYRNSNNGLRTFLQNLVDAGVADESTVFGGEEDEFLRVLIDADLPGRSPDLSVLWKLPAVAVASFACVPALLGYLGDAAGAHVPAWMLLVYSLASFLVGMLLVADASISDEEWEEWVGRRERAGELAFLESEEVLWRTARRVPAAVLAASAAAEAALRAAAVVTELDLELAFLESEEVLWRTARRVPAAVLAASAAAEAALRAAAVVTELDLQPPLWVAFLLFGLLLGVPYGVFSASFDPAVEGSWLGWEEFVNNIRDVVLRTGDGYDRRDK